MPLATRTFRVFVSSTFEDLKEERNALQRDVFPKLRKLCEQHGARFEAIDLRWGVRDEAALDQQTMDICMRDIRRCHTASTRPNFIVLLGDRYGWRPLPARIPSGEFDKLRPPLSELATQWYWLDENSVPPEYCLQPRTGQFVDPAMWTVVERALHHNLVEAAHAVRLPETNLFKYEASASHQEILACLGETEEDRRNVFCFFRQPTGGTDVRLEELKSQLRVCLNRNVTEFAPGGTTVLCAAVFAQIRHAIENEMMRFEDRPALDLEVEIHDRFAEERASIFAGRQAVLERIADYLRGVERQPLILHGQSGSGKSAVMAKASQQFRGPGWLIRRFISASPESANGHALLTSICRQMAAAVNPGDATADYPQPEDSFQELLSSASKEQPLVLFIDALDRLAEGDPVRYPTWLPPKLPPHVKIIVSTSDVQERLPQYLVVQLGPMTRLEAGQAIDEWHRDTHRTLQPWQRNKVLSQFEQCGLPLYLRLATEESRLWKSYASIDSCSLGEGIAGVIDTFLGRLANNANYGQTLVERSLGYLVAARYGLTEDELLDVLTMDDAVWADLGKRKDYEVNERLLPMAMWSRLSLDLEPYLAERAAPGGNVITFYYRQFAERVVGRFLPGAELRARHSALAKYFREKPASYTRRLVELVYQACEAGEDDLWVEIMTDFGFLQAVVERVDVTEGADAAGNRIPWHAGYFVVLDEIQRWLTGKPAGQCAAELIEPLNIVWERHQEFVRSSQYVMSTLYHELKALDTAPPKEVFDRRNRRIVLEFGPLWRWCERERKKYEVAGTRWVSVSHPAPTARCIAFISYRREGGSETARLIHKDLQNRGIRTFLDVADLSSGHFDERLLREIDKAPNFIVILTPGCLVRCNTDGDWLRREIEHAIQAERNIIPILRDGFEFPSAKDLPSSMADFDRNNGVRYDHVMFDATMDRIVAFLTQR